jgi:DNA-binding YbaB/EbfC family protein
MNILQIMNQAKELKGRLEEVKKKTDALRANGEAGGGMVTATISGEKKVLKIEVEEDLYKTEEKQFILDLITAAINDGQRKVDELVKETYEAETKGIMPNIPGMDLGGMFNK